MRISGLGVIEDAVLELAPGLTVVSGETGAGKTMVVTGLGLLFGGRADPGAVRSGTPNAVVEGRVRVDPRGPVAARVTEAGGDLDDDVVVLARSVSAEGRSRAYLGGRGVPASALAELADACVAVHGQSDQSRLLQPARQRAALDSYAGEAVAVPLAAYRLAFDELRTVRAELAEITERARERAQEADVLRFGLTEIDAVSPQPGEAGALAVEEARLGHADSLRAAADAARAALVGDEAVPDSPDATGLVGSARAALENAGVEDPELDALVARLRELAYLLGDLGADVASYASAVETDPARLAVVQERRAAVTRLVRKYADPLAGAGGAGGAGGPDGAEPVDEAGAVLAWSERAAARLAALEGDDDRLTGLGTRAGELATELGRLAQELTGARTAAAERFGIEVTTELGALAMANAAVEVRVSQTEGAAGAPPDDLLRVGGKAAVEVGRRLAALARSAQVVVVTHLPQVAAFADQHLVVRKADDGLVTRSGVVALDQAGRLQELSRMLAGLEESKAARAHAKELLAAAAEDKAGRLTG